MLRSRIHDVSKAFGHGADAVVALDRLTLDVRSGEFVCVIGASGCGKSTLLNLVAGLDRPSAGTVAVDGRAALMFQEAALFPWLTVAGNIELALRLRPGRTTGRRGRRSGRKLLETVHLEDFADRSGPTSCPAACASVSLWPGRSRRTPTCC